MVNKPAIEWKNLPTGCLVAITQGLVFAVRSIGPLPASDLELEDRGRAWSVWR